MNVQRIKFVETKNVIVVLLHLNMLLYIRAYSLGTLILVLLYNLDPMPATLQQNQACSMHVGQRKLSAYSTELSLTQDMPIFLM
jgi:hypothetical protein